MKKGNLFVAGLYLLMMVLLPFLHLIHESHAENPVSKTECCQHDSGHNTENEPHDSEHCSLCQLLVLAVENTEALPPLQNSFTLIPVFSKPETDRSIIPDQTCRARAPPFAAV